MSLTHLGPFPKQIEILKPIKANDRIAKASKKGKTPAKTFNKCTPLVSAEPQFRIVTTDKPAQRFQSTDDDVDLLTELLASTRLEPKPAPARATTKPFKRQRAHSAPSLVTSVAAGDTLADYLLLLRLGGQPTGAPINVHFYRIGHTAPIVDSLTIYSSEVESLVDLTDIILRRRRFAFRECDFTKKPPFKWQFSVVSKYLEDSSVRLNGLLSRAVVTHRFNEVCGVPDDENDDCEASTRSSPHDAFDRLLKACREFKDLGRFLEDDKDAEMRWENVCTVMDIESSDEDLSNNLDDQLYACVDMYFN